MSTLRAPALLLLALCLAAPAPAQVAADRVPLGDLIEIVELERELLAVDAGGGGTTSVRLHVGERVLWRGVRGLVAVAITDERVLAVATDGALWQEAVYEQGESPPARAALGDRVALVGVGRRMLGFLAGAGRFVQIRLGPQEKLRTSRVGANVAVVVSDRTAYGLSPDAGGFFPIRLHVRERIEEVVARSNLATVRSNRRVLVFRGPTGTWAERRH